MCGGGLQAAVGLFEGAGGDGGVVEVDGLEEGLAEHAADGVGRLAVEGADVLEEVEAGGEDVSADGEALVEGLFGVLETLAFLRQLGQTAAGGGGVERAVSHEVDEAAFFGGDVLELAGDGVVALADESLLVVEGLGHLRFGALGKVAAKGEGADVPLDVVLHEGYRQVRHVAVAVLASAAEVVGVGAAFAFGLGVDEAAAPAGSVAAFAVEKAAFEVVEVDAVAGVVGA